MPSRYPLIDVSGLRTQPIAERASKVRVEDFAAAPAPGMAMADFWKRLPRIFAGNDLREIVRAAAQARRRRRAVVWAMGAHVIKCGLSPVVIELMRAGVITCIAMNGAGAIHDSEIALFGATSEDVPSGMKSGMFGMVQETAAFLNDSARLAASGDTGFGESLGKRLQEEEAPCREASLLARAYGMHIPVTVHVGIGTDIVHMHPGADGAAVGEASLRDYRILTAAMRDLGNGGVLFNVGSAVILPEILLKAMTILQNLGCDLSGFLGVNLDFIQHYRSNQQVVSRVGTVGGRGISLTGHHEIMLPLIASGILDALAENSQEETA
ncbi:MAG: hypothetical protein IT210_23510 [Armatimonadetes bacterium]|nr:hypothetical protein [Armatimonadota bacterium]